MNPIAYAVNTAAAVAFATVVAYGTVKLCTKWLGPIEVSNKY